MRSAPPDLCAVVRQHSESARNKRGHWKVSVEIHQRRDSKAHIKRKAAENYDQFVHYLAAGEFLSAYGYLEDIFQSLDQLAPEQRQHYQIYRRTQAYSGNFRRPAPSVRARLSAGFKTRGVFSEPQWGRNRPDSLLARQGL